MSKIIMIGDIHCGTPVVHEALANSQVMILKGDIIDNGVVNEKTMASLMKISPSVEIKNFTDLLKLSPHLSHEELILNFKK